MIYFILLSLVSESETLKNLLYLDVAPSVNKQRLRLWWIYTFKNAKLYLKNFQ